MQFSAPDSITPSSFRSDRAGSSSDMINPRSSNSRIMYLCTVFNTAGSGPIENRLSI